MNVGDAKEIADDFLSDRSAWEKIAAELEVEGIFNVNSTSELAWEMLLKRNFQSGNGEVPTLQNSFPGNADASASLVGGGGVPFPRTMLASDNASGNGGFSLLAQPGRFTDAQLKALAREIVAEIQERGPFLSLSEFFNRQLSSDVALARAGAVESALLRLSEKSRTENPYKELQQSFPDQAVTTDFSGGELSYPFPEAAEGNAAYGFPGWTRQADVLRSLSGILTVRDDTFKIRAYGDARDPRTGKVLSQAWCEVTVQRRAEYVDSSSSSGDDKYTLPSESTLASKENFRIGRQFEVLQFRWCGSVTIP